VAPFATGSPATTFVDRGNPLRDGRGSVHPAIVTERARAHKRFSAADWPFDRRSSAAR